MGGITTGGGADGKPDAASIVAVERRTKAEAIAAAMVALRMVAGMIPVFGGLTLRLSGERSESA
jgi:hypothetical protein